MGIVLDILYGVTLLVALPFLLIKSWKTGKYRGGWRGRMGHVETLPPKRGKRIMIHCVSVGELLSTRRLIDQLVERDATLDLVITTTTDTSTARARELYVKHPRVTTARYPLDFSWAVRRFLSATQPDLIVLMELETWPNFLRQAQIIKCPVIIANGRLTARSFKRYRLIRPLMATMLRQVAWLGIQTRTIADRFIALGAVPDRITILPTIKYDAADFSTQIPGTAALKAAMGLRQEIQLIVAGSTGPGEEKSILSAYETLRKQHPNARLAIAPRKPETVSQVVTAIHDKGWTALLRSDYPDATATPADLFPDAVFVLNTLGELKKLYALGAAIFVGRSLVKLGGSDMIEVAAMAKPCCFGPHTSNFAEAVELLVACGGGVVVRDAAELTATFTLWLSDPAMTALQGTKAQQAVMLQRGSTAVYADKIAALLAGTRSVEMADQAKA